MEPRLSFKFGAENFLSTFFRGVVLNNCELEPEPEPPGLTECESPGGEVIWNPGRWLAVVEGRGSEITLLTFSRSFSWRLLTEPVRLDDLFKVLNPKLGFLSRDEN